MAAYLTILSGVTPAATSAALAQASLAQKTLLLTSMLLKQAAAWALTPMGMATIAAAGIFLLVQASNYFAESTKRATDALLESQQAYETYGGELDEIAGKISDIKARLDILNALEVKSPTDENTISLLERENEQLHIKQTLLENLRAQAEREITQNFNTAFESDSKDKTYYKGRHQELNSQESLDELFSEYTTKKQKIASLEQELSTAISGGSVYQQNYLKKQISQTSGELSGLETFLKGRAEDFRALSDGIDFIENPTTEDEQKRNAQLTAINEFFDQLNTTIYNNVPIVQENVQKVFDPFGALSTSKLQQYVSDTATLTSSMGAMYKEQFENGQIGHDTLAQLMESNSNWIDLITVENGVIKLNTEAVVESAKAKIQAKIEEIEANLQAAKDARATSVAQVAALKVVAESYKVAARAASIFAASAGNVQLAMAAEVQIKALEQSIAGMDTGIEQSESTVEALRASFNRLSSSDPFGNLTDSIKKMNDEAQKALESQLKAQGNAYLKVIDKRIKKLQEQKDAESAYYDDKIEQLKAEKDALNATAEEEDKLLNIKKAREQWENLQKQKNTLVYKKDQGWTYDVDQSAVDGAKDEYDNLQKEYDRYKLNQEIDAKIKKYEDAKQSALDALDAEIEGWQNLKDNISEQMSHIGESLEEHQLEMQLMADAEKLNFSEMGIAAANWASAVEDAVSRYNAAMSSKRGSSFGGSGGSGSSSSKTSSQTAEERRRQAVFKKTENAYAHGTLSAKAGLALVDDGVGANAGAELIVRNPSNPRLTTMEAGDAVFPAETTENLVRMASSKTLKRLSSENPNFSLPELLANNMKPLSYHVPVEYSKASSAMQTVNNNYEQQSHTTTIHVDEVVLPNVKREHDARQIFEAYNHLAIENNQFMSSMEYKTIMHRG